MFHFFIPTNLSCFAKEIRQVVEKEKTGILYGTCSSYSLFTFQELSRTWETNLCFLNPHKQIYFILREIFELMKLIDTHCFHQDALQCREIMVQIIHIHQIPIHFISVFLHFNDFEKKTLYTLLQWYFTTGLIMRGWQGQTEITRLERSYIPFPYTLKDMKLLVIEEKDEEDNINDADNVLRHYRITICLAQIHYYFQKIASPSVRNLLQSLDVLDYVKKYGEGEKKDMTIDLLKWRMDFGSPIERKIKKKAISSVFSKTNSFFLSEKNQNELGGVWNGNPIEFTSRKEERINSTFFSLFQLNERLGNFLFIPLSKKENLWNYVLQFEDEETCYLEESHRLLLSAGYYMLFFFGETISNCKFENFHPLI